MADGFAPKSVKDVPKDKFIEAYAAHLKANDKVYPLILFGLRWRAVRATRGRSARRLQLFCSPRAAAGRQKHHGTGSPRL